MQKLFVTPVKKTEDDGENTMVGCLTHVLKSLMQLIGLSRQKKLLS